MGYRLRGGDDPVRPDELSLQERYAPRSICFGCGPTNEQGLRIRSFREGNAYRMRWRPAPEHEAFPGCLSGGIAGTLADCHMNWAAADHLMARAAPGKLPSTVTADFSIRFLRPIPTSGDIEVVAHVVDSSDDRATVEATLNAGGRPCATARGSFVAVKEGHPAYHRW